MTDQVPEVGDKVRVIQHSRGTEIQVTGIVESIDNLFVCIKGYSYILTRSLISLEILEKTEPPVGSIYFFITDRGNAVVYIHTRCGWHYINQNNVSNPTDWASMKQFPLKKVN